VNTTSATSLEEPFWISILWLFSVFALILAEKLIGFGLWLRCWMGRAKKVSRLFAGRHKRRRARAVAMGLGLVVFIVIGFITTIYKMKGRCFMTKPGGPFRPDAGWRLRGLVFAPWWDGLCLSAAYACSVQQTGFWRHNTARRKGARTKATDHSSRCASTAILDGAGLDFVPANVMRCGSASRTWPI